MKPKKPWFYAHTVAELALVTSLVSALACAHKRPSPPPTRPPRTPQTHPRAPALSLPQWAPRRDSVAKAELLRLESCGNERIATLRDFDELDERGVPLMVEAAACFEQAGRWGHAIKLLQLLQKIDPERGEIEDVDYRVKVLYLAFLSDRDGAATLHARACGATIIDPPPEASAQALIEVATCLEQDPTLFTIALRYRRLAGQRGAGDTNAVWIRKHEQQRLKDKQALEAKGY